MKKWIIPSSTILIHKNLKSINVYERSFFQFCLSIFLMQGSTDKWLIVPLQCKYIVLQRWKNVFKKEEKRGWSYRKIHANDRVVEMINGVEVIYKCTTTLSDPSQKENDLQSVGSGKTAIVKISLYQLQQRWWVRQVNLKFPWQWITVVCARLKFLPI